ncbi:ATP-binding cassette domain-containing protein [Streptomyces sp. NBC_01363]|uniref:ATP-binding cassette domain-containing protein n=1 Tax=Streptomyces sp. NBC_01363 TaxID=2903840 RepID=UPI002252C3A5|nr:ATP-binding cassette domain-containing protein [Streptomyces sp. NBC_01363]MCX4729838.1 ATP-binding cassette domain-containing protein [Streptomyces sp. NBC_01363]
MQATDLRRTYGDKAVVDGVSLSLAAGTVSGFLGANGAGKTTVIRVMLGLIRGEGRTTYLGRPLAEWRSPATVVGAVLGGVAGHPKRRVGAHLRMVAAGVGAPDSRVDELLDKVGLTATAGARLGISSELARDGMDEAPRLARWQCDLFHPFKASAIFGNVSLRHRDDAVRLLVRDQHPHHNDCYLATLCDTRKRGPVRSRSGPRCAIGNVLRSSAG